MQQGRGSVTRQPRPVKGAAAEPILRFSDKVAPPGSTHSVRYEISAWNDLQVLQPAHLHSKHSKRGRFLMNSLFTVGSLLFILLAFTLSTSHGAPDRHLVRMEDLLRAGFDRHLVRLYRPASWGLKPRNRGRRSPGGGQQKFETTPNAEPYSRGVADTEDVRFLLPVDDARPKSGKCGAQAQPYSPPSYNRAPRIRNGTCTPYGAFPWTVQIQVKSTPLIIIQWNFEIFSSRHKTVKG